MSNSVHSSFSKVYAYQFPADGVVPKSYIQAAAIQFTGLITGSVTGMSYTQVKDTEQESAGGAEEFYPGRAQPVTASLKFSYTKSKLKALWQFLPQPIELRTQPDYGRYLFDFERVDGLRIRTLGYLSIGTHGEGEDDRQTIEATVQGTGEAILCANILVPTASTSSQRPGMVAVTLT